MKIVPKEESNKTIRHHVYCSMAVGLVPIPLVDFAGMTGVQLNMLRVIAKKYEVPFSTGIAKNLISSLVGGALPVTVSGPLAASLSKLIPGVGSTVGIVTMPIVGGATTYAIGKVFVQHFASGGTFLTFDPDQVREYFTEMLKEGKKVAESASKK
ncbi:MAG: DUF697 domain-containing protein [Desulfobacteraceae bacterium]|nr:DUF697 domain-containing protein [Desulfobacteraceae bacterium]